MVVVLPAPLGPSRPRTSPAWTSKETSLIASLRPNRRLTPTTWTPSVTTGSGSGSVVGCVHARPLGIRIARGDRRQRGEGLRRVLPLNDREAVVGRAREVLRLVVHGTAEPLEGVLVEVVQPVHEALTGQVGAHGFGRLLELEAHRPTLGCPLMQGPTGLVLGEVVLEAADDRIAVVAVGVGGAHGVHEVAAGRAEV